ncbi:tyrosine-protein phosphatase [Pseudoalteromonas mariniglutinosa]|uniref:tyrosine-protein phosphatase n=1 Tax=Pseudoalteromonas mariniglutinosa TaxID=206042 RepID=UPI00384F8746
MFDIHTHILPGVDDGAKDLIESLALLKMAQHDGITHVVATPHIHLGRFDNCLSDLSNEFAHLKQHVEASDINIKLALAAEVRLDSELIRLIKTNQLPFIGKLANQDYLLLELPHSHVPEGYDKFIMWLQQKNIRVVIPHPERNRDIQKDRSYIKRLVNLGCDFQLTASSIEGLWGVTAKQLSEAMLSAGIVKYIASDAHSVKRRPPVLSRAKQLVSNLIGKDKAQALFVANPAQLTESLFVEQSKR